MKRIIFILISACMSVCMFACPSIAQTVSMEAQNLTFSYPDSWLVLSPQLAMVYAPLLEEKGIDASALSTELEEQGILSRAYRPDFSQHMSVIVKEDALSQEIFQIEEMTEEQKKELRSLADSGRLFETTGYRAQDVEWQKEGGDYWLYIHYLKTFSDKAVGRGLRYVTVKNGMYVMLDWQIGNGRFGNRDLSYFRTFTHDLSVTKVLDSPTRTVRLAADIPQETTTADLVITGKTTGNATLIVETMSEAGGMEILSVGQAGANGAFSLLVPLEEEGTFDLRLTASKEGMNDASVSGTVTFSAKTLPVTVYGIEDSGVHTVTENKTVLSGQTLAGVQMQLVTPFGLSKKRSNNDGTFSFDLSTETPGEYRYTLILNKNGFNQRRIPFTLVRVMTEDQEHAEIRKAAEKIAYKQLQKNLDEHQGKVMSLYGPVTEVSSGGGAYYVRMHFNKGADGVWYNPVVIASDTDMGAKIGDMITAVVEVDGVFEEQDAQGEPLMIPRFNLLFVDKIE